MRPVVFVVSDSLGETAELVTRAAASQFDADRIEIRRFPYVSSERAVVEVVAEAERAGAAVVFTLILPELRRRLQEEAASRGVPAVDLMGPLLEVLARISGLPPKLEPGIIHRLDEEYFRRVEAVEFAVKHDDGKEPRGLLHADIVLIGVSRTSKTPVSMYLAHRRYKVANVPLVPELEPPPELFRVEPGRLVGLTIQAEQLARIRQQRLQALGLGPGASYGDLERIRYELDYARRIFERLGCPVIDVTNKAVEETAAQVLELVGLRSRRAGAP
jgi:regulator of PEP synthase PpsR (kinase-PPPase family)